MRETEQQAAAKEFAKYWKGKGYEKGESQAFWLSLLRDVYGVEHPEFRTAHQKQIKHNNLSEILFDLLVTDWQK